MKTKFPGKKIKVERSILLVFLFAVLAILLFIKLISVSVADSRTSDHMVNHTYEIIKHIENIESAVAQSSSTTRAFIATRDGRWKKSLDETHLKLVTLLMQTKDLVTDGSQQKRLTDLEQVVIRKMKFQQSLIKEPNSEELAKKISYDGEDRIITLRIQSILEQFMDNQRLLLQERSSDSNIAKNRSLLIAMVGAGIIFFFILGTLLRLNKDIRRRKEVEQEIRESESKYRQMIEEAGVTMFTASLMGTFTYVSSRCHALTGYAAGELTGENFGKLVLPDYLNQVTNQYVQQVTTNQRESTIEFPIVTRNGDLKWVEQHAALIYNEQLEPTGYQCVVKDITERKQSEQLLKSADQKIRAMLSSTREGFYMISPDYTIVMINEAAQKAMRLIAGKDCKLGASILEFIRPEEKDQFRKLFARVINGNNEDMEVFLDTTEGEKWFNNSYFPVRDDHDRVIAVCASSKDVTERKLVEKALDKIRLEREQYQFRLQSILDNTPAIVFVKDLEGRYLLINDSFREAYGLNDEQVIGKTNFDFESKEDAGRYKKSDEEVIRTLSSIESEETLDVPGKGLRNVLLVKFPLFDKDNTVYGVGGIATDFTENVQNRHKLIEAKKKAESAEQLQEQFLANMSHEIRTPMNGITGMTNILMGTSLDEKQTEYVGIIKQSSDNLLILINDILDLSKIKAGKLSLERTAFNPLEVIDNTMAPFHVKAREKNIELRLVQGSQPSFMILGDPYRLNQILNNLLSNAMKFTELGSVTLSIKQTMQTDRDIVLEFAVSDTGVGIESDKLDKIFNSFEQASSSTTRVFGGTGLGLAITKKLVEMQKGSIGVSSEPGVGTTFHFSIRYPIASKEECAGNNGTIVAMDTADLAGKRILVVEDNEINQKVIYHVLEKEGMKATLADNGREAVTLLEQGMTFDIIIMDLQMPVMDGFQAATYIRNKLNYNTPIIAMTASVLRNEKAKCFELGMNEYLTKPFVPAELFAHLKRFLFPQSAAPATFVAQQPAEPAPGLYSLAYLQQMDDNEYLSEILQLFLDTTPAALGEIRHEVLHENWDVVAKQAHKLKSSLNVLQMSGMVKLVSDIESRAKNKLEVEKIENDMKEVTEQFGLIRPMIEAELAAVI